MTPLTPICDCITCAKLYRPSRKFLHIAADCLEWRRPVVGTNFCDTQCAQFCATLCEGMQLAVASMAMFNTVRCFAYLIAVARHHTHSASAMLREKTLAFGERPVPVRHRIEWSSAVACLHADRLQCEINRMTNSRCHATLASHFSLSPTPVNSLHT